MISHFLLVILLGILSQYAMIEELWRSFSLYLLNFFFLGVSLPGENISVLAQKLFKVCVPQIFFFGTVMIRAEHALFTLCSHTWEVLVVEWMEEALKEVQREIKFVWSLQSSRIGEISCISKLLTNFIENESSVILLMMVKETVHFYVKKIILVDDLSGAIFAEGPFRARQGLEKHKMDEAEYGFACQTLFKESVLFKIDFWGLFDQDETLYIYELVKLSRVEVISHGVKSLLRAELSQFFTQGLILFSKREISLAEGLGH